MHGLGLLTAVIGSHGTIEQISVMLRGGGIMTTSSGGSDDAIQKKTLIGRVVRRLVDAAVRAHPFVGGGRHFRGSQSTTKLSNTWRIVEKEVHYLVYFDDRFIVYIDRDLDIEWKTTQALDKSFDQKGDDIKSKHYSVLAQAAAVETMPTDGLDYQQVLRFKRLIGEAIVCCLVLEFDNALSTIGFARDYLRDRTQEVSRFWYLSSSMLFAIPFILAAASLWLARTSLISIIGIEPFWLIIASCSGAIGALLSVMTRTGNLTFNSSSGRRLHRLEALSRISVGAISGGVVGLAVQSKLVLGTLASGSQLHLITMIAAFAAGAGERLAPSIIAEFEKKVAVQQGRDDVAPAARESGQ